MANGDLSTANQPTGTTRIENGIAYDITGKALGKANVPDEDNAPATDISALIAKHGGTEQPAADVDALVAKHGGTVATDLDALIAKHEGQVQPEKKESPMAPGTYQSRPGGPLKTSETPSAEQVRAMSPNDIANYGMSQYVESKQHMDSAKKMTRQMEKPLLPEGFVQTVAGGYLRGGGQPSPADFAEAQIAYQMHKEGLDQKDSKPEQWIKNGVINTLWDLGEVGDDTIRGLSTPSNIMLLAGMAALPELGAPAIISRLVDAGFSIDQARGAVGQFAASYQAHLRGDDVAAGKMLAGGIMTSVFSALAAHGAAKGTSLADVKGTVKDIHSAVKESLKTRSEAKARDEANAQYDKSKDQFKKAIPPTHAAPYSDEDYDVLRPHAEKYHANNPIEEPKHVAEAAEHAGQQLDAKVRDVINSKHPNEPLMILDPVTGETSGGVNVKKYVAEKLADIEKAKPGTVDKAMEVLSQYNLTDPTLSEADNIRKVLNDELRGKEKDLSDTEFIAKWYAAEALREGIYNRLESLGVHGAEKMRSDRAALSRIRDAAERQEFSGDKTVPGTGATRVRKILGATVQHAAGAIGAAAGGAVAGLPGASIGAVSGEILGHSAREAIAPSPRTRSQLIQDSFSQKVARGEPGELVDTSTPRPQPPENMPPPAAPEGAPPDFPPPPQKPAPAVAPVRHRLNEELSSYLLHADKSGRDLSAHMDFQDTTPPDQLLLHFMNHLVDIRDDLKNQGGKYSTDEVEAAKEMLAKVKDAQAQDREFVDKKNAANQEKYGKEMAKYNAKLKAEQIKQEETKKAEAKQEKEQLQANLLADERVAHGVLKATEPAHPIDGTGDGRTSEQAHGHEGGHFMAAVAEGLEPMEFLSAAHPDVAENNGRAQINIDTSMAEEGNKGIIQKVVAALGGAAYDEVHNGIKLGRNTGARGDIKRVYELLREGGLKPGSALEKKVFNALYERAKKHVSNPSAKAIMDINLKLREAGLDPQWHMSPERTAELNKKLQGIYGKTSSTEVSGERNAGGRDEGAVDAGGTGKEPTGTGEGVRAEAARKDGEGAEGKPKPERVKAALKSEEPTEIKFLRNTKPAPNFGERFGQHVEPAGRYMIENTAGVEAPKDWEAGTAKFKKPFVIDFGGGYQEPTNWKHVLSQTYEGKTGKELSDALRKDGYDAVITKTPDGETSEIVDLRKGEKAQLTASEQHPEKGPVSPEEAEERYQRYQEAQKAAEAREAAAKAQFKKTMGFNLIKPETEPEDDIQRGANEFNYSQKRSAVGAPNAKHDPVFAKQVADAYETMKHDPNNPEVKKSYDALTNETRKQWDYAQNKMGIKFEPWNKEGQPYANSKEMVNDVRKNKHLYFFQGGDMPADHPMAKTDPETGLTYNDMFRAVHDLFGHAAHGFEFGPKGEENAYRVHRQMFSDEAIPALTSETRGQNSWVNFGKHLRNAAGEVAKKGEEGYVPPAQRPYAEQKAGVLPEGMQTATPGPAGESPAGFGRINARSREGGHPTQYYTDDWKGQVRDMIDELKYAGLGPNWKEQLGDLAREFAEMPKGFADDFRDMMGEALNSARDRWAEFVEKHLKTAPAGGINPNAPEAPSKRYGLELIPEVRSEGHPNEQALREFAQRPEVQDALATHPDIKLGWDTTGEKPEMNIGVSTDDKQTALDVAKKLDQRALWDNEAQDTVPVGGEGKKTEFPEYPLEQRLKDLKIEKLNLKGSSVPLMKNPLEVKAREGGKIDTIDVAKALAEHSKSEHPALKMGEAKPEEMVKRASKIAEDEAKYQMASGKNGKEWYTTEMKEHDDIVGKLRPELLTGEKMDNTPWPQTAKQSIFKAAEAILSSGQKPYANLKSTIKAWDLYHETGEFPRVNPDTGKSWGPRNVDAYGKAFDYLNQLIKEKGEKGAATWLLGEHTVEEARQYNKDVKGKKTDMVPGAVVLGPKRGPFMQNLHGFETAFTADMWVSRTWNRWMGTVEVVKDDHYGEDMYSDRPRNNTERGLMKESFAKAAKKLNLSTSALQAVLWYYEQALYSAHGVPKESWSFSDAAKRVQKEAPGAEEQESFPFGESEKAKGVEEGLGGLVQPSKFANIKGK